MWVVTVLLLLFLSLELLPLPLLRWSVMAYETKLSRPATASTSATDWNEGSEVWSLLQGCNP